VRFPCAPLSQYGSGIKAARFDEIIAVSDVAPTLATMLDIETPSDSSGRVLDEIFADPSHDLARNRHAAHGGARH